VSSHNSFSFHVFTFYVLQTSHTRHRKGKIIKCPIYCNKTNGKDKKELKEYAVQTIKSLKNYRLGLYKISEVKCFDNVVSLIQGCPKSKPLPNDKKSC